MRETISLTTTSSATAVDTLDARSRSPGRHTEAWKRPRAAKHVTTRGSLWRPWTSGRRRTGSGRGTTVTRVVTSLCGDTGSNPVGGALHHAPGKRRASSADLGSCRLGHEPLAASGFGGHAGAAGGGLVAPRADESA